MTPTTKKLKLDEARLVLHRRLKQLEKLTSADYIWPSIDDADELHDLVALIDEGLYAYVKTHEEYLEALEEPRK